MVALNIPEHPPEIAYEVQGWSGKRRTLDIQAVFRHQVDAMRFQMHLVATGGRIAQVGSVHHPDDWFDSVEEAHELLS